MIAQFLKIFNIKIKKIKRKGGFMITYERVLRRISEMEYASAGKSVWGRELYYYKVGHGEKKLFINAAHHGNEYITS